LPLSLSLPFSLDNLTRPFSLSFSLTFVFLCINCLLKIKPSLASIGKKF
jgi:hypothetical protein